jgi:hypothetical protein
MTPEMRAVLDFNIETLMVVLRAMEQFGHDRGAGLLRRVRGEHYLAEEGTGEETVKPLLFGQGGSRQAHPRKPAQSLSLIPLRSIRFY